MKTKPRTALIILAVVCIASAVVSALAGSPNVSLADTAWRTLALPRLCIGMLAGAGLAMAGAMFQALFRNPLASPYTLGVSSGASLGAAIVFLTQGGGLWYGLPKVTLAAFAGAIVCVSVVYMVASFRQGQITILLLAGITIGFICNALIVVVLFLVEQHDLGTILQWMMGSLQIVGFDPVIEAVVMVTLAAGLSVYLHRDLDLLMMGETMAAGRGVPVRRSRALIYFSASLLTAGVVAHCGPIAFVGLMIPHVARFLVGPSHRFLLPASVLAGAAFLPLCDAFARGVLYWMSAAGWWAGVAPREVPVGVLTNLIGGGFFLYLLLARRRDRPIL